MVQHAEVTAKVLMAALRRKYPDAAILGEVTMEDEDEAARHRTYWAQQSRGGARARKWYDARGLTYDAALPEDYHPDQHSVTTRRIDALMLDGQQLTAIEIKISRADFFRDTEAKRAPWQRHTHRFIYLTPAGLLKPEEIPAGCGWWEYSLGQIEVKRRAVVQRSPRPLPASMMRYFIWRAFSAERVRGRF